MYNLSFLEFELKKLGILAKNIQRDWKTAFYVSTTIVENKRKINFLPDFEQKIWFCAEFLSLGKKISARLTELPSVCLEGIFGETVFLRILKNLKRKSF